MGIKASNHKCEIDDVQETDETLTGRTELAPFLAYLKSRGVPNLLAEKFNDVRKSSKDIELGKAFKRNSTRPPSAGG